MPATPAEIEAFLRQDEPKYMDAAAAFGADALPHLARIIKDPSRAGLDVSKAAYLAAVIGDTKTISIVNAAKSRKEPEVRIAAAAGTRHMLQSVAADSLIGPKKSNKYRKCSRIALELLEDADPGVRKVAERALPQRSSPGAANVFEALRHLAKNHRRASIRASAKTALERREAK